MLNKNFVTKQVHKASERLTQAYENDDGSEKSFNTILAHEMFYNYWAVVNTYLTLPSDRQIKVIKISANKRIANYDKECSKHDGIFSL